MIEPSEIKRGTILELDGSPWLVVEVSTWSPSARGASTTTKVKVRHLITGQVLTRPFRTGELAETADCERRPVQFLYSEGDDFFFMDEETFDQFTFSREALGEEASYLTDGLSCRSLLYNEKPVSIELPNSVELEVVETTPTIKGATAQAKPKPATLSTGLQVMVPPYLEVGERVRVDTRTGRFIERVRG